MPRPILRTLIIIDQILFLPTGDGIYVYLIDLIHPFDVDISIAITVLERVFT